MKKIISILFFLGFSFLTIAQSTAPDKKKENQNTEIDLTKIASMTDLEKAIKLSDSLFSYSNDKDQKAAVLLIKSMK